MKNEIVTYLAILAMIGAILVFATPVASAGVTGQLWLEPIGGVYVDVHPDDWQEETWIIGYGHFDLNITNHHQSKTLYILYIITAVNSNPTTTAINVLVNNVQINDWTPAITGVKPEVPTDPAFEYPPHGIYQDGTWYNITKIELPGGLAPNRNITIPIDTSGNSGVKIHSDGVGADDSNKAVVFVPPSHDATSIPEFPTIALPITAILAIMFILQRRKKEE